MSTSAREHNEHNEYNLNWLPTTELYKYAKEGAVILALTRHEAAVVQEFENTVYLAHAEGLGHVNDGYHVLVFGEEYSENDWGIKFTIPAWWFLNDGKFETPGNPIKFIPILEGVENEKINDMLFTIKRVLRYIKGVFDD